LLNNNQNRKGALAITVILTLLVSALAGTLLVNLSKGYYTDLPAVVKINSPSQNQVYSSTVVTLSVTIESPRKDYWEMTSVKIKVYIDYKMKFTRILTQELSSDGRIFTYKSVVDGEEMGRHILYVVANIEYLSHHPMWPVSDFTGSGKSDVVNFRIDIPPPIIGILSIDQQQTFNVDDVPLVFTLSKTVSWMGYSLDGQENVTFSGNTTLAGLSEGTHSVVVYANDSFGQTGKSLVRYFTVATTKSSLPFPTAPVVAIAVISAVAISAGFLIYLKRRRTRNNRAGNK
jgi:hypothetical protein